MGLMNGLDLTIAQEERRQAAWDRRKSAYPDCICCGHSIFGCETYRQIGNYYICGDCDCISEVGFTVDLEV